jgi:hypothetical protein
MLDLRLACAQALARKHHLALSAPPGGAYALCGDNRVLRQSYSLSEIEAYLQELLHPRHDDHTLSGLD